MVIIGANDGKLNDPCYDVVMAHKHHTKMLLVEPQKHILPFLQQHYDSHPDAHLVNAAVGDGDALRLYAIKPDYWGQIKPDYAKDWPDYRACTGVTSSARAEVVMWVEKHSSLNPDDVIEALDVPAYRLVDLCQHHGFDGLDVLQIDAEGADDYVLYQCDIAQFKPKIVLMETKKIPADRLQKLFTFWHEHGYDFKQQNGDGFAVLKG